MKEREEWGEVRGSTAVTSGIYSLSLSWWHIEVTPHRSAYSAQLQ